MWIDWWDGSAHDSDGHTPLAIDAPLAKLPLLANLLAGLGLLAALRLSLASAGLPWVALALAAAGVAHVLDLSARWKAAAGDALNG